MSNITWNFNNKKVLIVGDSRGIGECLYANFVKSGADVYGINSSNCDISNIDEIGLNQLESLDSGLDSAITRGDIGAYLRHNYEFHKTLYSFAEAPILESLADNLWLRYGPSLRVVCGRVGTQNLIDHHKQAIAAVGNGQFDEAAAAMSADVNEGIDYVIAEFSR